MAKNIIDELTGYRVKVEKDGREIVNIPGILALPGALIAPKASIIGTVAASLLGCNIHLENADGKGVDVSTAVRNVADTAKTVAKSVKDDVEKAWDELSADDPEGCPLGEENEEEPAGQDSAEDGIPTIQAKPDDSEEE